MKAELNQIHKLLINSKKTLAVAESCTGGLLCERLTRIPGSSGYFLLGIIAYSNSSKNAVLKIPMPVIDSKGAVSSEVAEKMAKNARGLAKADFGIGITGIAGPTGAVPNKPVGTVFIAINSQHKRICRRFRFKGSRTTVRKRAALKALELLKLLLIPG